MTETMKERPNRIIDHTGQRFGRLTVIELAGCNKHGKAAWNCRCDCGNKTLVCGSDLRTGHTQSCGCLQRERVTSHRRTGSKTYLSWIEMRQRCLNSNSDNWRNYGGRGIRICERWQVFENFLADMGERPEGTSIDRIDNDGNYESSNCRWATNYEQQNNTRQNRRIEYGGRTQTVAQWARELGVNSSTLHHRMFRSGWPIERALEAPVQQRQRRRKGL